MDSKPYCWCFRNPVHNHLLDISPSLANNGIFTTNLNWLAGFLNHQQYHLNLVTFCCCYHGSHYQSKAKPFMFLKCGDFPKKGNRRKIKWRRENSPEVEQFAPEKFPIGSQIVFQPPFFRGKLWNFGGVIWGSELIWVVEFIISRELTLWKVLLKMMFLFLRWDMWYVGSLGGYVVYPDHWFTSINPTKWSKTPPKNDMKGRKFYVQLGWCVQTCFISPVVGEDVQFASFHQKLNGTLPTDPIQ